ncbi:glycosyltransferase [Aliarcobacter butzleri]|uniref:glycosyltransferase n=1 Tax=Aliarcobacter butzleri TaxID=28197 RepID=UPI001EDC72FF|nr:glycosyltransferase [Aliarcobacter butzleri]MCG3705716.1 glycosyltransferase [Aliarcobacter butzleri]
MNKENLKEGVSYLIASYNHSKYIIYLLDSILEDIKILNKDTEIILIDDGSSDNSKEVLSNWLSNISSEIKIEILYQTNKGFNATLNRLISLSSYEFLRICGSDDIVIPGSTALMYNYLDENENLIAVSGDGIVIDGEGNKIYESSIKHHKGRIEKLTNPELLNSEIILNWCLTGPSTLIKRSHYDNISYDEKEVIDDFFLFLSIVDKNGLKIISDKVNQYRIHDTNVSKTKDIEKRLRNQKSFLNCILSFIHLEKKYPALSAIKNLTEAKIFYLEKRYLKCSLKMCKYFYYRLKV